MNLLLNGFIWLSENSPFIVMASSLLPEPNKTRSPAYRRIAEDLRNEILVGNCKPGTKLPSTGELASLWHSSSTTIHSALMLLVKQGWIERLNGAGTYVADPGQRFVCAGIYHPTELCSNESTAFERSLHMSLLEEFQRIGKATQVFLDSRPLADQATLLPSLDRAVRERRIQCLVTPTLNPVCFPALARLTIPTVFPENSTSLHRIGNDFDDLFRKTARKLAEQGCRSAGILGAVNPKYPSRSFAMFYRQFEAIMREEGLTTRADWILKPEGRVSDHEMYGYTQFMDFWKQSEKPDGFIVYPDTVARGVITAILELGIHSEAQRVKFIFHRNANIKLLCPFPMTWIVSNENTLAKWMVRNLEEQFKGEAPASILLPYELEESGGGIAPAGSATGGRDLPG
jgi:DNA-binding LacI/PurR family transcriptional regulator